MGTVTLSIIHTDLHWPIRHDRAQETTQASATGPHSVVRQMSSLPKNSLQFLYGRKSQTPGVSASQP